jgi:hypothetical protein
MLAPERSSEQPFEPSEARFVAALRESLSDPAFLSLDDDEKEGKGWFAERALLLRPFWKRLRQAYDARG